MGMGSDAGMRTRAGSAPARQTTSKREVTHRVDMGEGMVEEAMSDSIGLGAYGNAVVVNMARP